MKSDPFGTSKRAKESHDQVMADMAVNHERSMRENAEGASSAWAMGLGIVRAQGQKDYIAFLNSEFTATCAGAVLRLVHAKLIEAAGDDAAAKRNRDFLLSMDRDGTALRSNKERRDVVVAAVRKRALELRGSAVAVQKGYVSDVVDFAEQYLLNSECIATKGGQAI